MIGDYRSVAPPLPSGSIMKPRTIRTKVSRFSWTREPRQWAHAVIQGSSFLYRNTHVSHRITRQKTNEYESHSRKRAEKLRNKIINRTDRKSFDENTHVYGALYVCRAYAMGFCRRITISHNSHLMLVYITRRVVMFLHAERTTKSEIRTTRKVTISKLIIPRSVNCVCRTWGSSNEVNLILVRNLFRRKLQNLYTEVVRSCSANLHTILK